MQTATATAPTSNAAVWTGRALSGLVVAFMIFDGGIKVPPLDIVIETSAQMELPATVGFARTLGIIGLAATALYAWPRTAFLGAILLTGYMGGAIATHLRLDSPLLTHTLFGVYLGLMVWGGLYLRDERVRALISFGR